MKELSEDILARLQRDGYAGDRVELIWQADLRHEGQATELTVPLRPDADATENLRERFVAEYLKIYGYKDETSIDLVKLRLIGRGLRERRLDFAAITAKDRPAAKSEGSRGVSFERGQRFTQTSVVSRQSVGQESKPGPLIIDEFDATIVVPPDARVRRDAAGSIVMELGGMP